MPASPKKSAKHSAPAGRRRPKPPAPRPPPGLAPGTLRPVPGAHPTTVNFIAFDERAFVEGALVNVGDLVALRARWPTVWVDVVGLEDVDRTGALGNALQLHPLAMEDVLHVSQRAKIDTYPLSVYVVMHFLDLFPEGPTVEMEQLSLFFGADFVLTIQEHPGDPFALVRDRLRTAGSMIRSRRSDFLAYALIDATTDHLFGVLEVLNLELESLEDQVSDRPDRDTLASIRRCRRVLGRLRRTLWPMRDTASALQSDPHTLIHDDTRIYLRDVHDHLLRIIELTESARDEVASLGEAYNTALNHRMNEVMGLLTLVGAIFMPLTFLTGLYGMNFDTSSPWNLPELSLRFGYPLLWLVMLVTTGMMVREFWKRGWFVLTGLQRPPPVEPTDEGSS